MSKEDVPFRAMLAYKTFQKTGRVPDVEFMDSYTVRKAAGLPNFVDPPKGTPLSQCEFVTVDDDPENASGTRTHEVKKAADETDINDLQGAASTDPIRGYRGKNMDEMIDDFENSSHFANERKKIADRVNSINPKKLNPGYEKMIGTTGYLETPGDVGAALAESVEQDAISDGDIPQAYLDFMRRPHSKAIVGKMKSHGFSDKEIQSTLRLILEGYDNPRAYQDY